MLSTRASSSFNKEGTLSIVWVSSAMMGSIAWKQINREDVKIAKEDQEESPQIFTD
jgi:hypothetical protein